MRTRKLGKTVPARRRCRSTFDGPSRRWHHQLEALERRDLLAADGTCWVEPPADEVTDEAVLDTDVASAANASASISAVRAAEAGSTTSTAYDLGVLSGSRSLAGSVGGLDPSDVVKFTLTAQSSVTIGLSGLRSDIDLALYNSAGQRIGLSNKGGSASESISQTLSAGVYYVVVAPWRTASSTYTLSLSANAVSPPATTTPPVTTTPPTTTTPTDPSSPVTAFPDVAYYGGANDWNLNAINAPEVWAQGYTGSGVTVAVVDTGVDLDHSDLLNQIWVNADEIAGNGVDDDHNGYVDDWRGWDFVSSDNNPDDGNGHGTHVAGTIAADNNGTGATGVAPDATIMPVRVLDSNGSGTLSAVAAGIRYAASNGADIINLSLGGAFSSVIQTAIQYAQSLGVLVVAAAGNESASTPSYPARFAASLSNVLSVGAHNSSNSIASFSNDVGNSGAVQVDAPGVGVYSTYINNRYASLSGTSMATPHVAGLAALALSANQSLTATQLRNVIVNGTNRTIAGSDSEGGINAALTVALAVAGQTSASATTSSATTSTATVARAATVRRFSLGETDSGHSSLPFDVIAAAQAASQTTTATSADVPAPSSTSAWLASALDAAILSLVDADACDDVDGLVLAPSVENDAVFAALESLTAEGGAWERLGKPLD